MQDKQLYQQSLGLTEPWFVEQVELDVEQQRVDVWVNHRTHSTWSCPQCGHKAALYDHVQKQTWRHLDTCQFQTVLHARLPRANCSEHGVLRVSVPWAQGRSRLTMLFEHWIIDVLQQCRTVTGACNFLNLNWEQAWGVMQRAVERGQARKQPQVIAHLGVDEKAFRKGHSYMTVVCDLDRSAVEYVAEDRTSESLAEYYRSLSPQHLNAIEAVAMDMWNPYVRATLDCVPLAADKIVYDRFHIMNHMNDAVNKVRVQEHRVLTSQGDDALKGTKYWWLYTYTMCRTSISVHLSLFAIRTFAPAGPGRSKRRCETFGSIARSPGLASSSSTGSAGLDAPGYRRSRTSPPCSSVVW